MKLFTIGDSVSQGFMSLAAARTDLSYSTLLARAMGLGSEEYRYPEWGAGGLPLNVEAVLRRLSGRFGTDLSVFEALGVYRAIDGFVDETKAHYETGAGAATVAGPEGVDFFHNVAVQGFDVADSWLVTPKLCRREIELSQSGSAAGPSRGPGAAFYRTALKVLNPSLSEAYDEYSQMSWLKEHAGSEGGVENLVLWLGANNALGTVINLDIKQTPGDGVNLPEEMDHVSRDKVRQWNLWHPDDFTREYEKLLDKVEEVMRPDPKNGWDGNKARDWKVFVGTVPLVTVAPLAKGVGPATEVKVTRPVVAADGSYEDVPDTDTYYKYYVWFPFEESSVDALGSKFLTIHDAMHVDECIREYNRTIGTLVKSLNERHAAEGGPQRYHVVDLADALHRLAWKRNRGNPTYEFPPYFKFKYPSVNTKYYHANAQGQLTQGGIFSLDGVHPSAIGHGLLAHEFTQVMGNAGVDFTKELPWPRIFADDTLYSEPVPLVEWLFEQQELAERILNIVRLFRRRD